MFVGCIHLHAQQLDSNTINVIHKPNLITAHPLGLLLYRINHNFNFAPVTNATIQLDMGSANIWLPEVKGYLPTDPNAVEHLSHFPWHQRDSVFQAMPRNYDSIVFRADGVVKTFQLSAKFPIHKNVELTLGLRTFLLTTGSDYSTWLTSDAFIENFHQYIAGGNNPFARKQYGFNKAGIYYRAPSGETIRFDKGNFVVAGINADMMCFPSSSLLQKHHMYLNTGLHIGLNTTKYNMGVDLGLSFGLLKQFWHGKQKVVNVAAAGSVMCQRLIDLGATSTFIHSKYLPAFEAMASYRKLLPRKRFLEYGLDFYCLGPYNPTADLDRITPVGNRLSSHWHYALTHLYTNSQNWTITFAYGSKWKWIAYVTEDFKVNNAPDIQTGLSLQIPILNKQ